MKSCRVDNERVKGIDTLKFLAAYLVVLLHSSGDFIGGVGILKALLWLVSQRFF